MCHTFLKEILNSILRFFLPGVLVMTMIHSSNAQEARCYYREYVSNSPDERIHYSELLQLNPDSTFEWRSVRLSIVALRNDTTMRLGKWNVQGKQLNLNTTTLNKQEYENNMCCTFNNRKIFFRNCDTKKTYHKSPFIERHTVDCIK